MWNNLLELETCGGADNTSAIVNDGAWHHVAAVWYGSDNATLYVDGVSSSYPHPQPLPSINILSSGHLNIGQLVQYGANFIGLVNEVQIFNRPLSASEIQAIFNAGSTGLCRYAGQVQPPINADGTSIFTVRRGVVPVKFALTQGGVATCDLPPATIAVTRTGGGVIGQVNESTYTGSADSGSSFRIDSCRYIYNLNSRALGVGIYRVDILINGQVVGSATFELR
jgi:Concanavalin A-like lectin/glucanases superfamily